MNGIFRISPTGPLPLITIILLIGLFILIIPLLILGLAGAAFSRLGFSWIEATAVILLMLLGSFVNIPIWTFRGSRQITDTGTPVVFDAFTGEPVPDDRLSTGLFLNLGGAVIPSAVTLFLLYQFHHLAGESLLLQVCAAIIIVATITGVSTRVIPAYGIRAPILIPAVSAIVSGILLTGNIGLSAAVVAFAGGTMGILVGATLSAINAIRKTGIPSVSIGGTGMFWAVFFCGLLAALIA
ncbi:MAG: DUF1614 domain-containing protein [Methanoregula sp.]|nr:MAG: DUF1614 domain-containing protein [Methanoregula sp.]